MLEHRLLGRELLAAAVELLLQLVGVSDHALQLADDGVLALAHGQLVLLHLPPELLKLLHDRLRFADVLGDGLRLHVDEGGDSLDEAVLLLLQCGVSEGLDGGDDVRWTRPL